MSIFSKQDALEYHAFPRPGKVEVVPSKRCADQRDLSLAYSPGVAEACTAIHSDVSLSAAYTNRNNLVAVVSNGTAVLGLGNIGPHAAKPVMEGKGVLFKIFADIDVFDLELATTDPDELIGAVKLLEPTFGGINLEDIKAPECFYIEEQLKAAMNIPVFHDDQHGTAVISGAALLNTLDIAGKSIADCKIVVVGAGAAGIACANLYIALGIDPANLFLFDSKGLIHSGRSDLNTYKAKLAQKKDAGSLADVLKNADMFLGLSTKDLLSPQMVASMHPKHPVILACANPDPEIPYETAKAARPDCIMGTGRSDYPNQVNNVSGFPFIFRGALDTAATQINEAMKMAAVRALAALAKEPVPDEVGALYGGKQFSYGLEYVIPKPLDPRLPARITPAVAQAAMDSGVARRAITNMDAYAESLRQRIGAANTRIAAFVASHETPAHARQQDA